MSVTLLEPPPPTKAPVFEPLPPPPLGRWRPLALVARGVFIEVVRRKDIYVLFIMMALFATGAGIVAAVGVENSAVSRFVINLGLTLASWAAHILGVLLAARQIPADIEQRTIFPMLAKPLGRGQYIVGKWLACSVSAIAAFTIFSALGLAATALLPRDKPLHAGLLAEAFLLQWVSLAMICALATLATIVMPHGVGVAALLLMFFAGDNLVGFIEGRAAGSAFGGPLVWAIAYLPNFAKLNLLNLYTDGLPAFGIQGLMALAYGAIFTLASLTLARAVFARRPL